MATKLSCMRHLHQNLLKCRQSRLCTPIASLLNISRANGIKTTPFDSAKTTHFGFQTVTEEEKQEKVLGVFNNVAEQYDVMNDVMSAGIHRLWKDHFVSRLGPTDNLKHIDVAGGTGDIAFRILQYIRSETKTGNGSISRVLPEEDDAEDERGVARSHVTVCDINQSMLDVGRKRAKDLDLSDKELSWLVGDAECLPFANDTFDSYTIAYGIRNVTHIEKVLTEAYRVLKPGGRFMCLEFSQVPNRLLRKIYDEYSYQLIPVMGQLIAADFDSYQYLVESIRRFPSQEIFKDMIISAGFREVTYENLFFGVTAIHSGFKL